VLTEVTVEVGSKAAVAEPPEDTSLLTRLEVASAVANALIETRCEELEAEELNEEVLGASMALIVVDGSVVEDEVTFRVASAIARDVAAA
jgi:DNA-binding transcriptional regulator YbjK